MSKDDLKERIQSLHLTRNIGLKIVSLVVATVLWLIVVNITDPVATSTFRNVPVRILNADAITENGLTYEVLGDSDIISSITIKAPRTVIQDIGSSSDYLIVTADMSKLSADKTMVPIEVSTSKYSDKIESIRSSSNMMQVSIENRKTVQLPIFAKTSGEMESGYVEGDIKTAQNQVRISGPQSIIERIDSASVEVQVTGFTDNISTTSDIVLTDAQGEVIPTKNLTMNVDAVRVDVEILATKKVPVYFNYTGTPAEGFDVTGEIECDVETVVLAGNPQYINNVTQITVPQEALNVTGQNANLHVIVDLNKYLPNGTRIGDATFNGLASVTVFVEPIEEETYSVYLRNIEVESIPEGFSKTEWAEDNDYIEFTVEGLNQNLGKVSLSQLDYRVDFSDYLLMHDVTGFKTGVYELPLNLNLPDGVQLKDNVMVKVRLLK